MVPNQFPLVETPNRIALVGEAPGKDEAAEGVPFVGQSGKFLNALLSRAGTSREHCFVGNVCQEHPPSNEIAYFDWTGPEIQEGLVVLKDDLERFKPNIVICLGGAALHGMRCPTAIPKKYKKEGRWVFHWPYSPLLWRGSFFSSNLLANPTKCIATVHPAYVLQYSHESAPLLQLDLKKAVASSHTREIDRLKRVFETNLTAGQIITRLQEIKRTKPRISIDIEGGIGTMSCISFAVSKTNAFIVPFFNKLLQPYFSTHEESLIWYWMAQVLEDPDIPKILQNSLYDLFVLWYSYGIEVRGLRDDTMLKHWEYYCELEKALDVQVSLYTNEPYYKGDRKTQDDTTFFNYCCMDSATTYEINDFLEPCLTGTRKEHYRFNMDFLATTFEMEKRGILYDSSRARKRAIEVSNQCMEEQARLNGLCGVGLHNGKLFNTARSRLAKIRAFIPANDYDAILDNAYKDKRDDARSLAFLVKQPNPTLSHIGQIENLIGCSIDTGSNKDMCNLLYNVLGLPTQYPRKKRGQVTEPRPTADYEALLKLCKYCTREEDKLKLKIVQTAIKIRSLSTRSRMLRIYADPDGRIRCGYNVVGASTGRITCYGSPTGSGYNLQTIPTYDRDLFLADDGCWIFQCDLSGADGWTVAAYAAMLGDRTMLDDYLYGLKPAKILVLALEGVRVDFTNRSELKEACKKVSKDSWAYFAMKRVQHGCSYVEGPQTVSDSILTDSEGALFIEPSECKRLRDSFFFKRYPGIPAWHRWYQSRLNERPTVIAASGSVRHFFGRKEELLPKAIAHEPQHNTTYATKLAIWRCKKDQENNGKIIPLHTVHDSFIGEFRKEDTEWAVPRIREYFNNPLTIAGQRIIIPFEGTYGPSWGEQNVGVI